AMMRRVASQAAHVPVATVAALRPPSMARGRDIGTIERHSPTTNRRSGLAARSVIASSSSRTTRSTAPSALSHAHLSPRAATAGGGVGGTDGTIDQSGPDGGLGTADGSTATDPQANIDPSFVDDGTLLKPVAVDTTVSDGSALMRTYRVRSGDTLTGIAHKFG